MDLDRFASLPADVPCPPPAWNAAPAGGAPCSRTSVLLGMPHLDACGLSENWLQKTCGDRHWQALSRLTGRRPVDWRDARGDRVYAAFGYLRLSDARLEAAQEGQRLAIVTQLRAAGRSQALSRHRLCLQDRTVGVLALMSSFVVREAPRSNRKVRRIEGLLPDAAPDADVRAMQQHARVLRLSWIAAPDAGWPALVVHPCPRHDFNGAGLLYFASFGAWVDRALWQWGRLTPQLRVRERECTFLGNADPGEAMNVRLVSTESDGATIRWRVQLSTVAEERPLAVAVVVAQG